MRMQGYRSMLCLILIGAGMVSCATLVGQDSAPADAAKPAANDQRQQVDEELAAREQRLADYLNGVKLIGKFTIDGQDIDAKTEEYTISKCEKIDKPDMYRLTARIKYGEVDSELPLEIKILWSGRTPVITLDNFWIPGMGTFGARVLIHADRYAGTWQHDQAGGHMFGRIERVDQDETKDAQSSPPKD